MNIKSGTFVRLSVTITIILLLAFAGITIYVDPLFHYHGPVEGLQYPLYDERYMNDGIVKHFDYNCIITGTSMTENLKPSIWDSYYGTLSVKVPFSGGTFKEINSIV